MFPHLTIVTSAQQPHLAPALHYEPAHVMSDTISLAEVFSLVKDLREEQAEILNHEATTYQELLTSPVPSIFAEC